MLIHGGMMTSGAQDASAAPAPAAAPAPVDPANAGLFGEGPPRQAVDPRPDPTTQQLDALRAENELLKKQAAEAKAADRGEDLAHRALDAIQVHGRPGVGVAHWGPSAGPSYSAMNGRLR